MDNFDKIIIALAYHTNALSTLIPEISTFIANEDIAVNFIPEDIAVNLMQQWKRTVKRQKKEQKPNLHKKKNGSKKTGTLNTNKELTRKIKQTYNNIKIWNQAQENLAKSRKVFFKLHKRKKKEETNLRKKDSL